MRQIVDFERLYHVSAILSAEIPTENLEELPDDIAETLSLIQAQMEAIPTALQDLEAAQTAFGELDRSMDRVLELSIEAAKLPEDDQTGREARESEFIQHARIIARVAGSPNYDRPKLTLTSRAKAEGSYRVLKNFLPIKESLAAQLKEQEWLIVESIRETMNFLETISDAYPDAAVLNDIPDLLQRVEWVREAFRADIQSGFALASGLH